VRSFYIVSFCIGKLFMYFFIADTKAFQSGGFLGNLNEPRPVDPSLVPSSTYALSGPLVNQGEHMLGIPSHSLGAPIIQPDGNLNVPLPSSQQVPLEPCGAVSESPWPGTFPPTVNSAQVSNEGSNASRGQKRKGDEGVAKPAKKARSNDTENGDITPEMPGDSVTGKEVGEGTAKKDEVNERAGKPTLSGRVPLMPTHLAEAGYQAAKKGVRARNGLTTKPKSKGKATKPASKGAAKMPAKKKVK
jgi:hypothetical protein